MERLIAGATKLGLPLSPRQIEQFNIYYRELLEWNQRVNLTAITGYKDVQIKHFLDSLTITLAWQPPITDADSRLIDVGTGAGIPGLPLKIMFPNIRLVLLDATAKKAAFLYHLKQKLELDDVEIVVGRAEQVAHLSEYRERFNIVLSRAVAPLPTLVELALPFCSIGGSFIAQKKGAVDPVRKSNGVDLEASQAANAVSTLGGNLREVKNVELEEFTDQRRLIIIDKISATPPQYPRRPGIPSKRPIL